MGYQGDKLVMCLRCKAVGLRKELDTIEKGDGHCGIGDLVYVDFVNPEEPPKQNEDGSFTYNLKIVN